MLSPNYLAHCADGILALYEKLNDSIIEDLARRIVKAGRMTETAAWQVEKLNQAGLAYEDALRRISEITGKSRAELERLFEAAGVESLRYDDEIYRAAGLKPIPLRQSPAMLQILTAGMEKTRGEIENLVRTTANAAQSEFISACDLAYMQVSSGAFDYNTAIRHAVDSAAKGGLRVRYPTGWSDHLDVAVRRAVLTSVNQTCGKLQERRMKEMNCELVETTAHAGARESHAAWQGKIFSYDSKSKKYPDFRSSTGYGTGPGLMGWNCRHGFFPFFDGISVRAYSDNELRELDEHKVRYNETDYTDYEASQIQRKLERDIRAQKRMILKIDSAMKEAGGELKEAMQIDYNLAAAKLKKRERKLKDFLRQTGRLPDSARQQVSGFGRSQAQRAVHGAKKGLTNRGKSGIIDIGGGRAMNLKIDTFSPCLIHKKTGRIIETAYSVADVDELKKLKSAGWLFDWTGIDLKDATVYKLTDVGKNEIQGLVALTDYKRDHAVYVNLAESAPGNKGANKLYEGVGGHLFAIAANESVKKGYGGFLFLDAKNMELVAHYKTALGAQLLGMPHPYRMIIDESAAKKLLDIYTLREG